MTCTTASGLLPAGIAARPTIVLNRAASCGRQVDISGTNWLMAALLYGAGLRLLESLQLRIKDADFASHRILVRAAKGDKDRITLLPAVVCPALTDHMKRVRCQHARAP